MFDPVFPPDPLPNNSGVLLRILQPLSEAARAASAARNAPKSSVPAKVRGPGPVTSAVTALLRRLRLPFRTSVTVQEAFEVLPSVQNPKSPREWFRSGSYEWGQRRLVTTMEQLREFIVELAPSDRERVLSYDGALRDMHTAWIRAGADPHNNPMMWFAQDVSADVRRQLAQSAFLASSFRYVQVWQALANDPDPSVRAWWARNSTLVEKLYDIAYALPGQNDPHLTPDAAIVAQQLQAGFARDRNMHVRRQFAGSTPNVELLRVLAGDPVEAVRIVAGASLHWQTLFPVGTSLHDVAGALAARLTKGGLNK